MNEKNIKKSGPSSALGTNVTSLTPPKTKLTRAYFEDELARSQEKLNEIRILEQRLIGNINHTQHLLSIGDF